MKRTNRPTHWGFLGLAVDFGGEVLGVKTTSSPTILRFNILLLSVWRPPGQQKLADVVVHITFFNKMSPPSLSCAVYIEFLFVKHRLLQGKQMFTQVVVGQCNN